MVNAKNIAELSVLAQQLNSQSDTFHKCIETLNDKLAVLNIRLRHWLSPPLETTGLCKDSSSARKYEVDTYLAYAKIDDLWQLAIKEQVTDYEWNPDEREEQTITEVFMTPLLQASRDVRLSAVDDFDDLIEGLKRDVEAKLKQTSGPRN